ncbi:hypothetical protein RUND412_005109 [Rhizina undulata]
MNNISGDWKFHSVTEYVSTPLKSFKLARPLSLRDIFLPFLWARKPEKQPIMERQPGKSDTFHSAPSVQVQVQTVAAPWPISRPMSPYIVPTNCAVANEWQKLRPYDPLSHERRGPQFHYTPQSISRPHSPPSLSPSPAPSLFSYDNDPQDDTLEIEEISDSEEDDDTGIELLVGEYEEAPEDYGRVQVVGFDEDEDVATTHSKILHGLTSFSANHSPSIYRAISARQKFRQNGQQKSKRSYTESIESSDSEYESGFDYESFRRTRRRVGRNMNMDMSCETLSVSSRASSVCPQDFDVDMEL